MEAPNQEMLRVAELETWNPAFFRDILKAVAAVNEEPGITLDPEGLRITQMSPDHYAMVDLLLTPGFFDSFNVVEEYRAAINLKDLHKILFNRKTGKLKDSSLSAQFKGNKATFTGTGKLSGFKTLNLSDPYEDQDPTPKLIYNAKVTLTTDKLKQVIEDCTVDPFMLVTIDPDKIMFRCEDGDYLEENTLEKYNDHILELYAQSPQKALYWLEHLEKFPRLLKRIAEVVTLEFSSGQPLKISAELHAGSHLVYYIPPKALPEEEPDDPIPHEEPAEIPQAAEVLEEPINIYQELKDLGFFAYSGEDGDLFRKQYLAGWRVRVYPGHVSIQTKSTLWKGRWVTVRDFGIEGPRGTWTPETEKALKAVKELIEMGTLEEDPGPHEEPAEIPEAEEIQPIEEIPDVLTVTAADVGGVEEILAVEAAPDPHEEPLSHGELYQKYYLEALARHSAEDA